MSEGLSESAIVRAVAKEAARRIARKVIADLQETADKGSGDDSELETAWDHICAQVQHEKSSLWDLYEDTVRAIVMGYVADLPQHEREAMWLQTDAGSDWVCAEPEEREANPVRDEDVVDSLTREHVYAEAENWSNVRIRAHLAQFGSSD